MDAPRAPLERLRGRRSGDGAAPRRPPRCGAHGLTAQAVAREPIWMRLTPPSHIFQLKTSNSLRPPISYSGPIHRMRPFTHPSTHTLKESEPLEVSRMKWVGGGSAAPTVIVPDSVPPARASA